MDKTITINKKVDLAQLQTELQAISSITALSLDGDVDLILYNADGLSDEAIGQVVTAHTIPVKVNPKQQLKDDIENSSLALDAKILLKRLIDLR